MHFLVIMSDTFRRDHLGCYGNPWIHTENLDRLAQEAYIFDQAYSGSFPTVPNRAELFTGKYVFTYFDWAPLPREELVLAEILGEAGYTTMMIADTPHPLRSGYHYDRGFQGWHWIRGQENDRWMTDPAEVELPCAPHKLRKAETAVKQYLRNVSQRREEADYFVAQTMETACRWLERNYRREKFFLYVDTFDPHEPWDPPQYYVDLYDPGYQGEEVIYPAYARADYLSEAELKHMRALYAGEVTLVDRWVGRLLQKIDDLGLQEKTCVIFLSDHGFYHGEHGYIGKALMDDKGFKAVPLYQEVVRIPLLIRLPQGEKGRRIPAFAQPVDLLPTVLDLAGIPIPQHVHGRSLLPYMQGKADDRGFAVSSWSIMHGPGRPSTLTTPEWAFIYVGAWPEGEKPDQAQPIQTPAVDSGFRTEWPYTEEELVAELYHLPSDPGQTRNVIAEHREVAVELHRQYVSFLEQCNTPEPYLKYRRELCQALRPHR
ncbi:MAG: hypothetical protein D6736_15730 [Nitrospinota bacterium]|nr:MAG: hypothetical protein D6736_15730 [Nitrospinota bacterium]